ncbi:MAG: sensor domain-containing diguanylate cyclase [Labrenzia sp.]
MRLKSLLSLLFISMSAVPLFFGLQYLNRQAGELAHERFSDHLTAMSQIAKERIQTAVDRMSDNTKLVASRTQLRIKLAHWNATNDETHLASIKYIVADAKNSMDHLEAINIYDETGLLVVTTGDQVDGTSVFGRVSGKKVDLVARGKRVFFKTRQPLLKESKVAGHAELLFDSSFLWQIVRQRSGLGQTGEWLFAVRNDDGDALFAVPLKYDHDAALKRTVSKARVDVPITQALLGNETVMSHSPDYREVPVLAATRYLPDYDWGLVAKIDAAEVNYMTNKNQSAIMLVGFFIAGLAVVLGIALATFISHPIEQLKKYTEKVSRGEFEEPKIESTGWREARELASDFGHMVRAVQEMNDNLQVQVEERTRELSDVNKKLAKLATEDPLTGLYNRRLFDRRLQEEFDRCKRYGGQLAVVLMDIDHFKAINDEYGHDVGDTVLIELAKYIKSAVRGSDVAARIGGEEFCLLLPQARPSGAEVFLERVRAHIAGTSFSHEEKEFFVTCSFGLAFYDPSIQSMHELLKQADLALFEAKGGGRNQVVEFTKSATGGGQFTSRHG